MFMFSACTVIPTETIFDRRPLCICRCGLLRLSGFFPCVHAFERLAHAKKRTYDASSWQTVRWFTRCRIFTSLTVY